MAIKYFDKATTLFESGISYINKQYNSPLDVRTVVDTYADLDTLKTSTSFTKRAYDGMPVAVVNDTDSNIIYNGDTWKEHTSNGVYNGTHHRTSNQDDSFAFYFKGSEQLCRIN